MKWKNKYIPEANEIKYPSRITRIYNQFPLDHPVLNTWLFGSLLVLGHGIPICVWKREKETEREWMKYLRTLVVSIGLDWSEQSGVVVHCSLSDVIKIAEDLIFRLTEFVLRLYKYMVLRLTPNWYSNIRANCQVCPPFHTRSKSNILASLWRSTRRVDKLFPEHLDTSF